ncbi:MAG: DUF1553 domain-containing protein [Planctomycetota bacterium]
MKKYALTIWLLCAAVSALGAEISFNRDIRPILSENCFYCHGQDGNKRKAGLRLDVRDDAMKAAESGEIALVPGNSAKSALIARIFSDDKGEMMPPPKSNRSITKEQKELVKRWIAEGAKYEAHWSFIAPVKVDLPAVKNAAWSRNAIDRFVLAKLEAAGLQPTPEAERAVLIRRLSLDLTGLPPTPEEVDAFVADTAPDAYEKVVDRLLKSEHYGERMALPWLDAARYADSNGFQQDGDTFQWMWRDWVVRALNADMPFDTFSIEQLAGDLMPKPTNDQLIATAFNRNHLLNGEGGAIAEEQRFNILFDRVDTTATNWLGLTMACAQCHDHKYDPITQRDYYGLMASFNKVSESGAAGSGPGPKRIAAPFLEIMSAEDKKHLDSLEEQRKKMEAEGKTEEKKQAAFVEWAKKVTPETKHPKKQDQFLPGALTTILRIEVEKRSDAQKKELEKGLRGIFDADVWPGIAAKEPATKKADALKKEITTYKNERVPRVMVMRDDKPRDTFILDRGDYLKPKTKVAFSTPAFLPAPPKDAPQNRLGFAQWLFQPEHPLTARVQVNRMWQTFFGTGIIKTVEDLGVQSELPVHRDLLDWLAVEFRENKWNMKYMHRLIVTSATYRQSSRVSRDVLQRDPENRLMSRGARFRVSSLVLRDIALASSGLLDLRVGGAPVYPYQPDAIWESLAITKERDFTYPASKGADNFRRSLYTFWRRTLSPANMFDAPNRQTCKVRQSITNTPLHALTTLNDPTWSEASRVLAAKSMESAGDADARLTVAFRRVLGRKPSASDSTALRKAYDRQLAIYKADPKAAAEVVAIGTAPKAEKLDVSEHAALSAVCLAILNLDEALTRE